jgi:hypothetical protein
MITYNDVYEAKRNLAVSFVNFPLDAERRFPIASVEIAMLLQEKT